MEEIPRNPRLELQMAFAGPAVSGVVGLFAVYLAGPAAAVAGAGHPLAIMLWNLGVMNLILMAFNLLPAFPMDGGRLLRAWFAFRMPYAKATRRAADIGKFFATLMFLLGLFSLNFLLLFVAFFVYVGASEEEKATEIDEPWSPLDLESNLRLEPHGRISASYPLRACFSASASATD